MTGITPRGVPYAEVTDPLRDWPGVSQELAAMVDGLIGRVPTLHTWVLPSRVGIGSAALVTLGQVTVPGPSLVVATAHLRIGASTATAATAQINLGESTLVPWWGNPAAVTPNQSAVLTALGSVPAGGLDLSLRAAGQDGKSLAVEASWTRLWVLAIPLDLD